MNVEGHTIVHGMRGEVLFRLWVPQQHSRPWKLLITSNFHTILTNPCGGAVMRAISCLREGILVVLWVNIYGGVALLGKHGLPVSAFP